MPKPMPKDFGWRYVVWFIYTNALSIIMSLQLIFLYLSADSTLSKSAIHWFQAASSILGILIAQIKNRLPVPERPLKRRKVTHG